VPLLHEGLMMSLRWLQKAEWVTFSRSLVRKRMLFK